MVNLFKMELKTIVCDICKERPIIKAIEVNIGNWQGLCVECLTKQEQRNDNENRIR